MKKQLFVTLSIISLLGLVASAQQNVTIKPGDDVVSILATVVDENSTITFEAGYYLVTPKEDGTGFPDLMRVPSGTTIQGAGSGLDPQTATILDAGLTFDSLIKIDDNIMDVVVKDITVMRTFDACIEMDAGSIDCIFENVWALRGGQQCLLSQGWASFDRCVFGYSTTDVITVEEGGFCVFTNCDIFLDPSDLVVAADTAEVYYHNCIFYAMKDGDDIQTDDAAFTQVVASVAWDAEDGDAAQAPGEFSISGLDNVNSFIDFDVIGADPLYVKAPGSGIKMMEIDLHLQEGSPALTAGSTSFDADHYANGSPTYAGSQGLAPDEPPHVSEWSLY